MPFDDTGTGGGHGRRPSRNVLGETLIACSTSPVTGFFRNGCCDTSPQDVGSHTVCAVMTAEFLAFSRAAGNDLDITIFKPVEAADSRLANSEEEARG